jgi:hypothetical protein
MVDVLKSGGYLNPILSSKATSQAQKIMGEENACFFYAGRCLFREFGVALAIRPGCEEGWIGKTSKFDTGSVCDGTFKTNPPLENESQKREFIQEHTMLIIKWRREFSKFLGDHFPSHKSYWTDPPLLDGPRAIYRLNKTNFQSWTWEVRVHNKVSVEHVMAWCSQGRKTVAVKKWLRKYPHRYSPRLLIGNCISKKGDEDFVSVMENWARNVTLEDL